MLEIEKVQRRATKLVPSLRDLSYQDRLKTLKLPTLAYRRKRTDIIQVYRIVNRIDNIDFDTFFCYRFIRFILLYSHSDNVQA